MTSSLGCKPSRSYGSPCIAGSNFSRSSSSTFCRSAGSALVNSIRRPSAGCVNTSRAACRNGRSRCVDRAQVAGHAPVDAAVERVADDRMADRAQVHANLVRAAGVNRDLRQRQRRPKCSARTMRVTAARLRRARADIFFRLAGIAADRRVDPAAGLHLAPDERDVFLLDLAIVRTAAPAPRAPRRAWRRPSAPTCRGRADARCRAASRRRCRSDRRRGGAAR